MKKLLLLIIPLLLYITTININVKADSNIDSDGWFWFIPDLTDYTFNIPSDSEDFIFKKHDFETGNFVDFLNRLFDFGVSQTSTGALDFTNIHQSLLWVGLQSVMGDKYGLTPLIIDSLPSYITYNIYNTLDRTDYKGAVDKHVIIYRLDFMGNYSMLLNNYIYNKVYSLEIKYELLINYFDNIDSFVVNKGYTIHYEIFPEEYKIYTPMYDDELEFQLRGIHSLVDYQQGYNDGYSVGYDEGYEIGLDEGYEIGLDEGYETGLDEGYDVGYETGQDEGYDLGHDVGYTEGQEVGYGLGYEAGYDEGYDAGYDVGFEVAVPKMDILLITLIMYVISIIIYFKFNLKWVLVGTILLWFVPIFLVENLFIKIFSVIMIIVTITLTFFGEREEEF